jgi:hypothetical protein
MSGADFSRRIPNPEVNNDAQRQYQSKERAAFCGRWRLT